MRRQSGPRPATIRTIRVVLVTLAFLGCLGPGCRTAALDLEGDRWQHRSLGYSIAEPAALAAGAWKRISVPGADLAYLGPEGETMTLLSECSRAAARPDLLARQLLIGVGERELVESHPVALRGDPGWQQAFRTLDGPSPLHVQTVTLRSGACTFDWVLIARAAAYGPSGPGEESEIRDRFERWWSSFERDSAPGAMGRSR